MINTNSQGKGVLAGGMSPHIKKHLELEIQTLQNSPRDADKLERLFENKAKTKGRSYAPWRYSKVGY